MDTTVPTNTVQVLITTGTVTDSGSECTDLISDIAGYIYRTHELIVSAGRLTVHVTGMLADQPGTPCVGGERGEV